MEETPVTAESGKRPCCRRFRFSLRTLLIGMALLTIPLGYVAHEARIARERKAIRARLGDSVKFFTASPSNESVPWLRQLMGDEEVECIYVMPEADTDMTELRATFPEAAEITGGVRRQ